MIPDEFSNPDDLELGCAIGGEQMQKGTTRKLVFPVSRLIPAPSPTAMLYLADVVVTGTPVALRSGRDPRRFLQPCETWNAGSTASVASVSDSWRPDPKST